MTHEYTLEYAQAMDQKDPLKGYRERFFIPNFMDKEILYFTGNSLGLQPKTTANYIQQELNDWAKFGVEGHFLAKNPWYSYHELLSVKAAKIVGAKTEEVVITHSLTTNLHLLMASFYRPTGKRCKIICEAKAFPSDLYALQSQLKLHGVSVDNLVEIHAREGENCLRHEDIIQKIEETGDELALVMMGGVNFYTGQVLDMKDITRAAKAIGARVGFDLAHAAGNIELQLHDWDVDFAAWCTYKYLNSSPGGVSGLFVHAQHHADKELVRLAGWWGHDKNVRFQMESEFQPMESAEAWQLSNAPVLGMAAHLASLDIFDEVGMDALIAKRVMLSGYLEYILDTIADKVKDLCQFEIITPREAAQRGAQISLFVHGKGRAFFDHLTEQGVIADWREPNVIRVAPAPLYNSFEDVFRLGACIEKAILES